MRRAIVLPFLIALYFSLVPVVSAPSPSESTVVRLDPATVELGPDYCVNDTFTLKARVDNVEDLFGFGFHIKWNTTYLDYVDHIAKVPVEVYSDGLLHEPVLWVENEVNASEGWYGLAIATLGGPTFNGSGIAFEITFNVTRQPVGAEPDASFEIAFTMSDMLDSYTIIPHSTEHCNITIHPHWNNADINDDLKVDIFDVVLGVNAYQATPSDPHWNPRCDLTNPYGIIDIFDIVMICFSYGEEYTP